MKKIILFGLCILLLVGCVEIPKYYCSEGITYYGEDNEAQAIAHNNCDVYENCESWGKDENGWYIKCK